MKSETGFSVVDLPWLAYDDDDERSSVISFMGVNCFMSLGLDDDFYDSADLYYDVSESGEFIKGSTSDFFQFLNSLSLDKYKNFWTEEKNLDPTMQEQLLRSYDRLKGIRLTRALVLIQLKSSDLEALQDSLPEYFLELDDLFGESGAVVERASVGGDEVIADYLLTKYLHKKERENAVVDGLDGICSDFNPLSLNELGESDFSYYENLEHLHPYYYEDVGDYGHSHYLTKRTDQFYYRFDHEMIESMQQQLRIPYQIERILTDEIRVQLPQIFINQIMWEISGIKHEVFGMDPPPKQSRPVAEGSLQDYLGFDGPFSDSEMGDW